MAVSDWTADRVPHGGGFLKRAIAPAGDAFAANFEAGEELGASFAAVVDGEILVDIRGGHADKARAAPWTDETIACVYSSGKAVVSMLIAEAVSDGALDYDAPVAAVWPEFAQNGKGEITLAALLSHQAGLVSLPEETPPEDWLNWETTCARLAGMAPLWAPGTASGYHPQTFGFLAGEVLRRARGKSVGALIREKVEPAGLSLYCGMRPDEIARAAYMPKPPRAPDLGPLTDVKRLAFLKPSSAPANVSRDDWMAAELPASNMHANARALALFLNPMAGGAGPASLSNAARKAAFKERIRGDDLVLPFYLSWSAGLMRNINGHFGPAREAFGHAGFGGSCVVIDPDRRLTAAYVMSKMSPHLAGDPRAVRILNALYDAL